VRVEWGTMWRSIITHSDHADAINRADRIRLASVQF
jgi:hypothetical protein